jgi:hypothetical protein
MQQRNWLVRWALVGVLASCVAGGYRPAGQASGDAQTAAPAMAAAVDYPNAGISLAVPRDFEGEATSSMFDVMRFSLADKEHTIQAVSLSVFPVREGVTADAYAEGIFNAMPTLVFRQLRLLKKVQMDDVAGQHAAARVISYVYRGVEAQAATVYFIRELKEPKVRLFYALNVETIAQKQGLLIPTLDQVVKSITLSDVRHPSAQIKDLGPPVVDARNGFSIGVPRGWFVQPNGDGFTLGQTDYLAGGIPGILVTAAVGGASPGGDSQQCAKKYLADLLAAKNDKVKTEVISQGRALVGGDEGYQFAVEQSVREAASVPAAQTPAAANAVKTRAIIVRRVLCAKGDNNQPKSYVISLAGADIGVDAGVTALDKIAQSFKLLAATTAPATSSAPAAACTAWKGCAAKRSNRFQM